MYARRQSPKVKDGKVQKKNWHGRTHNYYSHREPEIVIDRKRPGPGGKHVLTVAHVREFLEILPHWDQWRVGLDAIVLSPYNREWFGEYWHSGVIRLAAWCRPIEERFTIGYYERDQDFLELLEVPVEDADWGKVATFTEPQARAFQLIGTFLHELGHHVDRMESSKKVRCDGGEPFAMAFEREWRQKLWPVYRSKLLR